MYFFKSQMCLLGTTARQTNELFAPTHQLII